ncbi:hypothetical protein PS874_04039 [Pseudomonas fluorescens]|nr:hypothetical protein PS874_04039 [Pseudomonas fluorescens]
MQTLLSQKFTAYVGIDWADIKHDVCLLVKRGALGSIASKLAPTGGRVRFKG